MIDDYLYPAQRKALKQLETGKILCGGVGSGKSPVAVEYYNEREVGKDVFVITTKKKRDDFEWQKEFARINVGRRGADKEGELYQRVSGIRSRKSQSRAVHDQELQQSAVLGGTCLDVEEDAREPHLRPDRDLVKSGDDVEGNSRADGANSSDSAREWPYRYVLTVDSWNKIGKYVDVKNAFFIFDEQRVVGSGAWVDAFLKITKNNSWILLTATPGDSWIAYAPIFIANGFYKNHTEFKKEHVVYSAYTRFPKIERYVNQGKLERLRRSLLVEMPILRHTVRVPVPTKLPYDKETLDRVIKDRWNVYAEEPIRDVAEMFLVGRRVVNSDPSRLEMVCELWKKHPKLIVFYNFNFELESLRSLREYYGISTTATGSPTISGRPGTGSTTSTPISIGGITSTRTTSDMDLAAESEKNSTMLRGRSLITDGTTGSGVPTVSSARIAEWNGHKHQPVPTSDRWLYLVQYTAGAEGWNCTQTDAMIMYSRNYSWTVTEQSRGRIDRLNTPFKYLYYYDFYSDSMIDKSIGEALEKKETFNVKKFNNLMGE